MRAVVEFTATTDRDAMLMADVLKGAEALGRLAVKEARPEFSQLLADMLIEADGGIVRVSTSIPYADVESVARVIGGDWLGGRLRSRSAPKEESSP